MTPTAHALISLVLSAGPAADPAAAIAAGDEAFLRIEYSAAVSAYETALEADTVQPDLLWRLARVNVCMGEVAEGSRRDSLLLAAQGFARRCLRADPEKSEGHTWLAAALGYLALAASPGDQLRLTHELLAETDRALALNPADDVAYSIKGSCYRALGNVGWLHRSIASILFGHVPDGGFEEAEAALQHAVALAPDVMRHQYELGVLYMDMGRNDDARRALEKAKLLPVRTAIDRPRLLKIKALLSALHELR